MGELINKIYNWYTFTRKYAVTVGKNVHLNGKIRNHGMGHIEIGDNVGINSGAKYNPTAGDGETHFRVWGKAKLVIKSGAGLSNVSITAREYVEIGERATIGAGVMIADLDFHSIYKNKRMDPADYGECAPVIIGDDVFIGARSIVLKGVTIGNGAAVGAGSVVTKSIPEGELWAGNPARFIRKIEE